jgi:hypothetical protein
MVKAFFATGFLQPPVELDEVDLERALSAVPNGYPEYAMQWDDIDEDTICAICGSRDTYERPHRITILKHFDGWTTHIRGWLIQHLSEHWEWINPHLQGNRWTSGAICPPCALAAKPLLAQLAEETQSTTIDGEAAALLEQRMPAELGMIVRQYANAVPMEVLAQSGYREKDELWDQLAKREFDLAEERDWWYQHELHDLMENGPPYDAPRGSDSE